MSFDKYNVFHFVYLRGSLIIKYITTNHTRYSRAIKICKLGKYLIKFLHKQLNLPTRIDDWVNLHFPNSSILATMSTVSPNRQYLGMLRPTTPEMTGPE